MDIRIVETEDDIARCQPVLGQLRPQVTGEGFVARIRALQAQGYRLAVREEHDAVRAVAGFRLGENLAWGKFLYVDDLVTDERWRSHGMGRALLDWLQVHAREQGCGQLHLDSGVQRHAAHRFYQRAGMSLAGHHFVLVLD